MEQPKMEYRFLGPTGLKVSIIGFGTYTGFGTPKLDFNGEQVTYDTVKKALELGINFFDTAEGYAAGQAEIDLGKAFKKLEVKREDIVVSTKIFLGTGVGGVNGNGLSRKHLIEGTNASLKRLQLDYVDVLFAHRPDHETPLEETCRAFDWLINQGKVFYWGTSEWSAAQISAAIEICDKLNLHRPVVEQPEYNLLHRQIFEVEYAPLYDKYGLGTTIWSPLAAGLLTGKYLKGEEGRMTGLAGFADWIKDCYHWNEWFAPDKIENTRKIFAELEEIAKSLGGTVPQLAIAWCLRNKDVSTAICGFTRVSHVEENIKAVELYKKFTPEIDERIEKLFNNRPDAGTNWKTFSKITTYRR